MLSRLHHRNIIQFFGFVALNLDRWLCHGIAPETLKIESTEERAWRRHCVNMRLAVDIASGLAYLHS